MPDDPSPAPNFTKAGFGAAGDVNNVYNASQHSHQEDNSQHRHVHYHTAPPTSPPVNNGSSGSTHLWNIKINIFFKIALSVGGLGLVAWLYKHEQQQPVVVPPIQNVIKINADNHTTPSSNPVEKPPLVLPSNATKAPPANEPPTTAPSALAEVLQVKLNRPSCYEEPVQQPNLALTKADNEPLRAQNRRAAFQLLVPSPPTSPIMRAALLLLSAFVIASLRSLLLSSSRFAVLAVSLYLAQHSSFAAEPPATPILRIETGMHTAMINPTATDAAGRVALTCSDDKTARLWSLPESPAQTASFKTTLLRTFRIPIEHGDKGNLYACALTLSPAGSLAALGG